MKYLIFVFLLLFNTSLLAVEVTDLYQANILVASQSEKDRTAALKRAMQGVILKVGGQESTLDNAIIKSAFPNVSHYLTQYRYERKNDELFLIATFDETKINGLFQQAELPIWGRLRPQVLIWLVAEDDLSRNVISESDLSNYPNVINTFSRERGLPIVLPLMDLQDNLSVNMTDLWGRFVLATQEVSARYMSDTVVVIRLSNSSLLVPTTEELSPCDSLLCDNSKNFALDLTIVTERIPFYQQFQGQNAESLLTQALNTITDRIYQGYALSTDVSHEFVLEVANIDNLTTLVDVNKFLQNLSAVESVKLIKVQGKSNQFKLKLLGSKQALLASLKLNKQLKEVIDPLAAVDEDAVPVYLWQAK